MSAIRHKALLTARTMYILFVVVPVLAAFGQTAKGEQAAPRFAQRLDHLPGLANVGQVAPGVYRGAQPGKEGYATLKRLGIRTVIDLRTTEDERARVEGAGMRAISVPLRMSRDGLREKVDRAVALMADPANQPVFVHCRHGQDRTGIVAAAYRMRVEGWSLAAAEAEMESFGFNDIWVNFKLFIRQYGAQSQNQLNAERR